MRTFLKTKLGMGIMALVAVVIIVVAVQILKKPATMATITVRRGDIQEQGSITGTVTSSDIANLSFQQSGRLARANVQVGSKIVAGQVLMSLDTSQLQAQRQLQQAQIAEAQARLSQVLVGATPQDIAVAQSTLTSAQNTLTQLQTKTALDAARKDINVITDALQLILNINDPNYLVKQDLTYGDLSNKMPQVRLSIYGTSSGSTSTADGGLLGQLNGNQTDTTDAILEKIKIDLIITQGMLDDTYTDLVNESASNTTTSLVTTARANVLLALNDIDSQIQSLITAENNVQNAQAALDLKRAPSTTQSIAIVQSQLDQAKASLAIIDAQISGEIITAPVTGVVTAVNFKPGETVTAGAIAVSVLNNSHFEIDTAASETDIGKIGVGNPVSLTIDAFPGETFTGVVFYIAPAETNTQGVVSYQVKISFDKPDPRLKSGLTANINIQTKSKSNVLILPQYAILQNDQGTFVETLENNKVKLNPVTLGIQDQKGNVEVVSGVTEGEQVMNIGFKTP